MDTPYLNSPIISNGTTDLPGSALYGHVRRVVLGILKYQYNVTRSNKKIIKMARLSVNKAVDPKRHFIGFQGTYYHADSM